MLGLNGNSLGQFDHKVGVDRIGQSERPRMHRRGWLIAEVFIQLKCRCVVRVDIEGQNGFHRSRPILRGKVVGQYPLDALDHEPATQPLAALVGTDKDVGNNVDALHFGSEIGAPHDRSVLRIQGDGAQIPAVDRTLGGTEIPLAVQKVFLVGSKGRPPAILEEAERPCVGRVEDLDGNAILVVFAAAAAAFSKNPANRRRCLRRRCAESLAPRGRRPNRRRKYDRCDRQAPKSMAIRCS